MKLALLSAACLMLTLVPLSGCSEDDPVAPAVVPECTGPVTARVTVGSEVVFSWSPDCALAGILVEPGDSGADQWMIMSEGANALESPVTYGVVPDGAREIHAAEQLVVGQEYDLYLFRWTGPGPQDAVQAGTATFTR